MLEILVWSNVFYTLSVGTNDTAEEIPQINYEELETDSGKKFIQMDEENRRRRVHTTDELLRAGDPDRLALADMDPIIHRGGSLLKNFLERSIFLRLSPRAIASFAPARKKFSPRLLDEEGFGLAELLGQLDEETLAILIEKLSFIIQEASNLQTHTPESPVDRRYFTFVESQSGKETQTPAWVLSEGTRRVTAILAVLLHDNPPPLLCIEEVENGLDPWTLSYLIDELASATFRGTQIILTTHSPYLLNMVPLENIILCDRQANSAVFSVGSTLQGLGTISERMGLGDLYANRYLHRSSQNDL